MLGSGFRRIMVVKPQSEVAAHEAPEAERVPSTRNPHTGYEIGLITRRSYADGERRERVPAKRAPW